MTNWISASSRHDPWKQRETRGLNQKEKNQEQVKLLGIYQSHWLTRLVYTGNLQFAVKNLTLGCVISFPTGSYVYLIYLCGERQCTKFTDIQSDWRVKLGGHYYFPMEMLYKVQGYSICAPRLDPCPGRHTFFNYRIPQPVIYVVSPEPDSLSPTSGTDGPPNHSSVSI